MEFSELLAQSRPAQGRAQVTIPADWLQGRSAFGGLQAALLVQTMRDCVPAGVPLRALQVTFVAPVPAGTAMQCVAQQLRQGKSATQVEARLQLAGDTLCLAVGVFGSARTSMISEQPLPRALAAMPGVDLPYIEGVTPAFTRHFSMRWMEGGVPFSGARRAESVIALGHRDPAPMDELHVVALADAPPPAAISLLSRPAAGSSLTWTLELLTDRLTGQPSCDWRFDLAMTAAADGYTQQSGLLWAPDGRPVALSRQTTVVFA